MQLEHELTVPLGLDAAWALILDIEKVARCFPGASLDSFDDGVFRGNVSVKLGPIAMKYHGAGEFLLLDAAKHSATIEAKGTEVDGAGSAGATVELTLNALGRDATRVTVKTDLVITGKPAQFGRGVISDVSDNLLKQFVANLEAQLEGRVDDGTATGDDLNMLAVVWVPIARRVAPAALTAIIGFIVLKRLSRSGRSCRPRSITSGR